MAEERVVKEGLTKEMIEAGAGITRQLDAAGLTVQASLWLYLSESNTWRFVVASPEVKKNGPKKVYKKVQSVLSKIPNDQPRVTLSNISVVEPGDPLVSLLRLGVRTVPGISGARFSRGSINGHFVEDTYIYRIVMSKEAVSCL